MRVVDLTHEFADDMAIGFDGPSADPIDTTAFELHRVWLGGA